MNEAMAVEQMQQLEILLKPEGKIPLREGTELKEFVTPEELDPDAHYFLQHPKSVFVTVPRMKGCDIRAYIQRAHKQFPDYWPQEIISSGTVRVDDGSFYFERKDYIKSSEPCGGNN